MRFHLFRVHSSECLLGYFLLSTVVACAHLSVTPQVAQHPDPKLASHAIEAERIIPVEVAVRDFDFSSSSVRENSSPLHSAVEMLRQTSSDDRRNEIARHAAADLSEATVKQLDQMGLAAVRVSRDEDIFLLNNVLVVTGRLVDVNEGNRFTRVAVGLGAGESRLESEVHVFRVTQGEQAEVLAFSTHADSGKMPGLAETLPFGVFIIGPITLFSTVEDAASSGEKIYTTQIDYLARETGDEIAGYLSQYSADQCWITASKARSVNLVTD